MKYWEYIDVRLNPDGTYEVIMGSRFGNKCIVGEASRSRNQMPRVPRSNIKDQSLALQCGRIYEEYFKNKEADKIDYGEDQPLVDLHWTEFDKEKSGNSAPKRKGPPPPRKPPPQKTEEFSLEMS